MGRVTGHAGPPPFFAIFGAFFVAIGLYFIVGRFFYKAWRNKRTYYAVTNQRILILTETRSRKVQAVVIKSLPAITKSIRANGVGTLRFGNSPGLAAMYENTGMELFGGFQGVEPAAAFHSISDAETVYRLVLEQQRAAERR
jgi:hypothetical protein